MFGAARRRASNWDCPNAQNTVAIVALSFLDLLQRLESGDAEAAALLFDRNARRLIGLARRRLEERVRVKGDADEFVISVIRTFCRRAAEYGCPDVHSSTLRKVGLTANSQSSTNTGPA
jgi:hypothetical protein